MHGSVPSSCAVFFGKWVSFEMSTQNISHFLYMMSPGIAGMFLKPWCGEGSLGFLSEFRLNSIRSIMTWDDQFLPVAIVDKQAVTKICLIMHKWITEITSSVCDWRRKWLQVCTLLLTAYQKPWKPPGSATVSHRTWQLWRHSSIQLWNCNMYSSWYKPYAGQPLQPPLDQILTLEKMTVTYNLHISYQFWNITQNFSFLLWNQSFNSLTFEIWP